MMFRAIALAALCSVSLADTVVDLALANDDLSTLVVALQAADLVTTLEGPGPFTVFAPTNEAFAALPPGALDALLNDTAALTGVLLYHVASGSVLSTDLVDGEAIPTLEGADVTVGVGATITINQATVVVPDNVASNGVVHVIDAVLMPPSAPTTVPTLAPTPMPTPMPSPTPGTIVDLALANPDLSTLVVALEAADLVTTLEGPGPFTVFAPTNEAFAALPPGALDGLLNDTAALTNVLLYHVASGKVFSTDLFDAETIPTLQGGVVTVGVGATITINQATVIAPDNLASNGVVHVIDAVLDPADGTPSSGGGHKKHKKKDQTGLIAGLCVAGAVLLIAVVGGGLYLRARRARQGQAEEPLLSGGAAA